MNDPTIVGVDRAPDPLDEVEPSQYSFILGYVVRAILDDGAADRSTLEAACAAAAKASQGKGGVR